MYREYDYKCEKCLDILSVEIKDGNPFGALACQKCGGYMARIYYPPNIAFKGTGFTRRIAK